MEAICKFDFIATAEDELSFRKGDIIVIISTELQDNWWTATRDGLEGLVPSNYIELKFNKWYRNGMTRIEAEQFLYDKHNGGFVIRPSESCLDGFSLSVKYSEGRTNHFKILKDDFNKYYIWIVKFNSINSLISYYKLNTLSKSQNIRLRDIYPQYVRAVYEFKTTEADELSFRSGDIILLTDSDDSNWWFGQIGNRVGQFPSAYVVPCDSIS